MITSSLDWAEVETSLMHKSSKLMFRRNIQRMVKNIRKDITDLSIAEIDARRGNTLRSQELLAKINQDIETVEGFLLVAALIGEAQ